MRVRAALSACGDVGERKRRRWLAAEDFLMTRFTASILMCPTNYNTAMLAFSMPFHIMRDRRGETKDGCRALYVSVIPVCGSARGSEMN